MLAKDLIISKASQDTSQIKSQAVQEVEKLLVLKI